MNCCATAADVAAHLGGPSADEIRLSARDLGSGLRQTDLSIPAVHCGACISAIEGAFASVDGVETARLNLT
ncbi:copper chaperone, partial [Salmonella enterica subsp. enterica serovar Kottbus]|nr:copper chaperone [Salmonella enterica subsp. enterica serovar Kottbus]